MSRRVVSLGTANRGEWLREVKVCLAVIVGPILVAGLLNLLFIEATPWLAVPARYLAKVFAVLAFGMAALVVLSIVRNLFYDDFGEGLSRLIRSLMLAELTTVIVPIAAAGGLLSAVASAHPVLAIRPIPLPAVVEIALFVGAGEAVLFVLAWIAGRLLRR